MVLTRDNVVVGTEKGLISWVAVKDNVLEVQKSLNLKLVGHQLDAFFCSFLLSFVVLARNVLIVWLISA